MPQLSTIPTTRVLYLRLMNTSIVAVRLQQLMDMRRLSQGQVETFTGVQQQNVSKILKEGSEPKIKTIIALARGLGVSADYLLGLPPRDPAVLEPAEEELLKAYKELDETHQKAILTMVKDLGGKK
jgi:transcriptional regulator with XRE-family HTH domain